MTRAFSAFASLFYIVEYLADIPLILQPLADNIRRASIFLVCFLY